MASSGRRVANMMMIVSLRIIATPEIKRNYNVTLNFRTLIWHLASASANMLLLTLIWQHFLSFDCHTKGNLRLEREVYIPNLHVSLSYLYPIRSGVGTTCFNHVVNRFCNYFYYRPPAWHQPSLKLEGVLTTANAAGTNGLTCLPKHVRTILTHSLPWYFYTVLLNLI
jgi:hypothetical protein